MNADKAEQKNNHTVLFVFFVVVFIIAVVAIFGDKGFFEVYSLQKDKEQALDDNKTLDRENKKIREEISRLENDDKYIAEIAKKELGMVGSDEVIYIVNDK